MRMRWRCRRARWSFVGGFSLDHPHIGQSMNNLALTYGALGRHEDALAMQESALEFRRRVLPLITRISASSMNNLAATYRCPRST